MDTKFFLMGKIIGEEGGGGEADLVDLTATSNGVYTHSGHDGYDEVTVNVPNSYVAGDEGKVVSNGALVSQSSTTKNANGTYDTTLNNEVVVNVANSYTSGDEGKVVNNGALVAQTSTTKNANGIYDTTLNNSVTVAVPEPSGNINITDTNSTNVSAYATAQVVDSDLVAGNIKKDVNILGVTGTYEGGGSSPSDGWIFDVDEYGYLQGIEWVKDENTIITAVCFGVQTTNPFCYVSSFTFPQNLYNGAYRPVPAKMFQNWQYLTTIVNWPYPNIDGVYENAFDGCSELTFTHLQNCFNFENITYIGTNAFQSVGSGGTTGSESITFGSGIDSISGNAFRYCTSIGTIYFKGTPSVLNKNAFGYCTAVTDIYVPWSENAIANAPWGATNATVHYDWTPSN